MAITDRCAGCGERKPPPSGVRRRDHPRLGQSHQDPARRPRREPHLRVHAPRRLATSL